MVQMMGEVGNPAAVGSRSLNGISTCSVLRLRREAVALAAQNPTLAYGLALEVRPLDSARADVLVAANETPAQWGIR